jgi:hypothetical protein
MTVDELEKISRGVGRGLTKMKFRNFPGGTKETRETGELVTRQRIDQSSSQLQSQRINPYTNLLH